MSSRAINVSSCESSRRFTTKGSTSISCQFPSLSLSASAFSGGYGTCFTRTCTTSRLTSSRLPAVGLFWHHFQKILLFRFPNRRKGRGSSDLCHPHLPNLRRCRLRGIDRKSVV